MAAFAKPVLLYKKRYCFTFCDGLSLLGIRFAMSITARATFICRTDAERLAKMPLFIFVVVYFTVMVRALVRAIYAGL